MLEKLFNWAKEALINEIKSGDIVIAHNGDSFIVAKDSEDDIVAVKSFKDEFQIYFGRNLNKRLEEKRVCISGIVNDNSYYGKITCSKKLVIKPGKYIIHWFNGKHGRQANWIVPFEDASSKQKAEIEKAALEEVKLLLFYKLLWDEEVAAEETARIERVTRAAKELGFPADFQCSDVDFLEDESCIVKTNHNISIETMKTFLKKVYFRSADIKISVEETTDGAEYKIWPKFKE